MFFFNEENLWQKKIIFHKSKPNRIVQHQQAFDNHFKQEAILNDNELCTSTSRINQRNSWNLRNVNNADELFQLAKAEYLNDEQATHLASKTQCPFSPPNSQTKVINWQIFFSNI